MKSALLSLLVLLLAPQLAAAGAWTRGKGEGFASQSLRYFSTEFSTSQDVEFARASLGLYLEYGVMDQVTLVVETDQGFRADDMGFGAQDGRTGGAVRVRLMKREKDVFSLQLGGSISLTGITSPAAPGGDKSDEIAVRALYGRGIETPIGFGWFDSEFGYSHFSRDRADEWRLNLTLGVRPDENWLIMAQMFNTRSLNNGGFGGIDYDLTKLQFSAGRKLTEKKTLLVGFAHDVFTRGTTPGYEISVSLWSEF